MTLIKIHNNISDFLLELENELTTIDELLQYYRSQIKKIEDILEPGTVEYKKFEKYKNSIGTIWTGRNSHKEYIKKNSETHLHKLNVALEDMLKKKTEPKKIKTFSKNQKYEAMRYLLKIFKEAERSIFIIDSYLDDEIFDYIDNIDTGIKIKLLTGKRKPIFKKLFSALKENRENIEGKLSDELHGRYILIDSTTQYHLGCSINGIGANDFTINKTIGKNEKEEIETIVNQTWENSEIIE